MKLPKTRWVALLVVGAALSACAGAGGEAATELTVEAKEFAFTPASLEVTAGQLVNLSLQNTGALEHDFSVMEFPMEGPAEASGGMDHEMEGVAEEPDLHVAAAAQDLATLEFTPSKPGTYAFWCTVSGHKEQGMIGTLVVKAP